MRTEKQIAASRANGAKSKGPRSPKRRAPVDPLGIAIFTRTVVLEGESRHRFKNLVCNLHAELKPETAIEIMLVQTMIAAQWRKSRVWSHEKSIVEDRSRVHEFGSPNIMERHVRGIADATSTCAFFNQQEMRYDRQFYRALSRFHAYRAERNKKIALEPTDGSKQST